MNSFHEAMRFRQHLKDLFAINQSNDIVLMPGILVFLQGCLRALDINSMITSQEEYYEPQHLPNVLLKLEDERSIAPCVTQNRTDAVLISQVSWLGRELNCKAIIHELRNSGGPQPIIIVDYSHAGAIGFPPIHEIDADIIVGDVEKWIRNEAWGSPLAFAVVKNQNVMHQLEKHLAPFYLALAHESDMRMARWVDPRTLREILNEFEDRSLSRPKLLERYKRNMRLAKRVMGCCDPQNDSHCTIVVCDEFNDSELLSSLRSKGLVWDLPDGRMRIICRSDVLEPW